MASENHTQIKNCVVNASGFSNKGTPRILQDTTSAGVTGSFSQEFQLPSLAASGLASVLYPLSDQLLTVPPVTCQERPQPDNLGTDDMLTEITRELSQYSLVELDKSPLVLTRTAKFSQKNHPIKKQRVLKITLI